MLANISSIERYVGYLCLNALLQIVSIVFYYSSLEGQEVLAVVSPRSAGIFNPESLVSSSPGISESVR
jgi:hypothetical protein